MHALKTPAFLRPSSRPNSPVPAPTRQDSQTLVDRSGRSSMLSFSTFKRSTPPAPVAVTTPLVQDGSYMESLNLKLSEAVSRALSQPAGSALSSELLNGKRPIPAGRGRALGDLIISEVGAVRENPHLHRAVLRTLHRPLSVLVNNLSNNLMTLLSSPAFLPAVPSTCSPNPNTTQLHALALATFAGELLEVFDEVQLCIDVDMRGEGLRAVRDGLVSIVKRVLEPLLAAIKNDLIPHVNALESQGISVPVPGAAPGNKITGIAKSSVQHPSIAYMQSTVPLFARAVSRYVTTSAAETILASFLINLIWHGLVALANRPASLSSPPNSPVMPSVVPKKEGKTPPTTPPSNRFALKLPPSRPPSPPSAAATKAPSVASDARAFYDLMISFPRPTGGSNDKLLAQEVVDEAFSALKAMTVIFETFQSPGFKSQDKDLEHELEVLTADLPTLISLPIILRTFLPSLSIAPGAHVHGSGEMSVSAVLGLSEAAYRNGCLSGFVRADECAVAVGQHVLNVLREEVRTGRVEGGMMKEARVVLKWLDREVALIAAGSH